MEMNVKDNVNKSLLKGYIFQFMVAFSASLLMMSGGISSGWPSPTMPKLMANDSYIPITSDDSSWIITTSIVGSLLGTLPAAWLMYSYGRKKAMLLCVIPYLLGWTLIGIANSKPYLFVGKFFLGFGFGWGLSITPIYLGEIASDKVRGSLSTLAVIMDIAGILYAYSIGPYVSISMMAWLCMIPTICFFTTFIWLPESPYFLLGSKKIEMAYRSLERLRGHACIEMELDNMRAAVKLSLENKGTFKELFNKSNRYRLFLIIGLVMSLHFTGCQAILSYTETIFRKMNSSLDPSHASIIYASLQLLSASFSSFVMDAWGRRRLLLSSLAAIGVCNSIVGLFFLFEKLNYDVGQITWLPVATLMTYIIFYTLGVGSVPYIILGEIFPKNIKSFAALLFVMVGSITAISTVKFYQIVSDNLGNEYAFLSFAIFCYIFLPIFWYFLPETKGKSLDMILKDFSVRQLKR